MEKNNAHYSRWAATSRAQPPWAGHTGWWPSCQKVGRGSMVRGGGGDLIPVADTAGWWGNRSRRWPVRWCIHFGGRSEEGLTGTTPRLCASVKGAQWRQVIGEAERGG
jgi:hypothetical protein